MQGSFSRRHNASSWLMLIRKSAHYRCSWEETNILDQGDPLRRSKENRQIIGTHYSLPTSRVAGHLRAKHGSPLHWLKHPWNAPLVGATKEGRKDQIGSDLCGAVPLT